MVCWNCVIAIFSGDEHWLFSARAQQRESTRRPSLTLSHANAEKKNGEIEDRELKTMAIHLRLSGVKLRLRRCSALAILTHPLQPDKLVSIAVLAVGSAISLRRMPGGAMISRRLKCLPKVSQFTSNDWQRARNGLLLYIARFGHREELGNLGACLRVPRVTRHRGPGSSPALPAARLPRYS